MHRKFLLKNRKKQTVAYLEIDPRLLAHSVELCREELTTTIGSECFHAPPARIFCLCLELHEHGKCLIIRYTIVLTR